MNKIIIIIAVMFLTVSCKNVKENIEIVNESKVQKTNIRFALKKENYKETNTGTRLSTTKTEVTSQHYQMEGPAWENENVAFRNYFDARNGMDIFGKRKSEMILDKVGIDENYHELQDWGMDILKVGNSLGAGGIAIQIKGKLFRVGARGTGAYELLEETPDKSSFVLTYDSCRMHGRDFRISHKIEIESGTHYYKSTVSVDGLRGDETFMIGIVDHVEAPFMDVVPEKYSIFGTHGPQALEGGNLGMAMALPRAQFKNMTKASNYNGDIDHSHMIELKFVDGKVEFLFFTGWEMQDARFKEQDYFMKLIKEEINIKESVK